MKKELESISSELSGIQKRLSDLIEREDKPETIHIHAKNVVVHTDEKDEPAPQPPPSGILGRSWTQRKIFEPNDDTDRMKATGWGVYKDDLYLMINSVPTSGSMTQTGSLIRTDLEDFEWLGEVLNETKKDWQGTQRTMPLTLDKKNEFVTLFVDKPDNWGGAYWGGRGMGLAISDNLRDWEYSDKPFFTAEDFYNITITGKGNKDQLSSKGEVYCWGGWYHNDDFYFLVDCQVNGGEEFDRICVKYNNEFELVDHDYTTDSKPIKVGGKWYKAWKSRNEDGDKSIAIFESDLMLSGYKVVQHVAVKDESLDDIVHPQLISYKGKFAVTWSQWHTNKKDYQSLYISVSD